MFLNKTKRKRVKTYTGIVLRHRFSLVYNSKAFFTRRLTVIFSPGLGLIGVKTKTH